MGGQACVFYGAAEFSRDADLVIVSDRKISSVCAPRLANWSHPHLRAGID